MAKHSKPAGSGKSSPGRRRRNASAAARRSPPAPAAGSDSPERSGGAGDRLQKVLAAAGIGSRRQCEELIAMGRVEVDGQVVTQLGVKVDAQQQQVRVDGEPIHAERQRYFVVHKPVGVVSTNRDPEGRPRVIDLIDSHQRLFTVGRLDRSSSGLLLVTNDGQLAHQLAHPRFEVEKRYVVTVVGQLSPEASRKLREGIYLAEGRAAVKVLKTRKRLARSTVLEIVLTEGKNREVRRMLAAVGHKVVALQRVAFGPLSLGELPPGGWRDLTGQEVTKLRAWIAAGPQRSRSRRGKGGQGGKGGPGPARSVSTTRSGGARTGDKGKATGGRVKMGRVIR